MSFPYSYYRSNQNALKLSPQVVRSNNEVELSMRESSIEPASTQLTIITVLTHAILHLIITD